jgi:hypothetical protein
MPTTSPRLDPAAKAASLRELVKNCAVLARLLTNRRRRSEQIAYRPPMPSDYLQKIQRAEFPLRIQDPADIACVAELLSAGLVDGSLEHSSSATGGMPPRLAVVKRITPLGWFDLMRAPCTPSCERC